MALTVQAAFDGFHNAINLPGDHRGAANKRKDHLVSLLANRFTILDAFGSGSIPRFTALKGNSDVDVFLVLHYGRHIEGKTPREVLQAVRDALGTSKNNVRKNGQAVTLYYTTWPNVDIVPVSRVSNHDGSVNHYKVPDMNTGLWIQSNPKEHSADIEKWSGNCGANFRKMIKMMKHWNRHHGGYLQSYHIEVMALNALTSVTDDLPWYLFQYFERCLKLTEGVLWHRYGNVDNYLSWNDRVEVRKRLSWAVDKARGAWYEGTEGRHRQAITYWKQIFGDDFPQYG